MSERHVRGRRAAQAKNLEQAFFQVRNAVKVMEIKFEGFADLPEEFAGSWAAGNPTTFADTMKVRR